MRITHGKSRLGYHCTVQPTPGVYVGAVGDDPADALHKAAGLAEHLAKTLAAHPELKMLLPPQVQLALKTVRIAAWAAREGHLPELAKKLAPQARRVVSRLMKELF